MSDDRYEPLRYDLEPIVRGDTFPAIVFSDSSADTDLARVRMQICNSAGTAVVTLDSAASGVTLNTTTAGSWNFTVGPIDKDTTEAMAAGLYAYDLESYDTSGFRRTEFNGTWKIIPQITEP